MASASGTESDVELGINISGDEQVLAQPQQQPSSSLSNNNNNKSPSRPTSSGSGLLLPRTSNTSTPASAHSTGAGKHQPPATSTTASPSPAAAAVIIVPQLPTTIAAQPPQKATSSGLGGNVVDVSLYNKAKKEVEKLEWTASRYLKELNDVKQNLSEKEFQISSLYNKIQQLESSITEKHHQIGQLEEQLTVLKEQEWLAQRTTAKMEGEIQSSRAYAVKVNELLDESVKSAETIKKNTAELEQTRRRCNHYRLVIEAMEKELRAARESTTEMKTLQDEIKTLKSIGIVKERDNLQMKNALQMLEAWFSDYDQMERPDFAEVKRRAIEGVTYPEGVDGDKYDQFFRRERIKREQEAIAAKTVERRTPGMHRSKKQDDDSDNGSGTKRSGSQSQALGPAQVQQSYLDLGTIPADVNFNLIEHIRDLVSTEDNFLLDHIRIGLRVQVRLDHVAIPTAGNNASALVADSEDVISARHLPTTAYHHHRSKSAIGLPRGGAMSARVAAVGGASMMNNNNEQPVATTMIGANADFGKVVSQVVVVQKASRQVPQVLTYSGLIRYVGLLDMPTPTTAVYAGVKLDDRVGYTNGTFLGKRYFFAPDGHGVFIRLVDITAILNTKNYEYVSLSRMFRKWKKTNQNKKV